jgi:hypothetical protein
MFQDFNFKLAVINELMYNQGTLKPKFNVYSFAEAHDINLSDMRFEYEMIPEVRAYFEALVIPDELLFTVERLSQDGGDDIYMQICVCWDGEDDLFNIVSTADCALVPNLKSVVLFYDDDEKMIGEFEKAGIRAEYV